MTLLERIGHALHRWRPWPQVGIYGGGGALLVAAAFAWTPPDASFHFWFRLVVGTGLILLAAADVWVVRMERRRESGG